MSKRMPMIVTGQPNPETELIVSKTCANIVAGFTWFPPAYSKALIPEKIEIFRSDFFEFRNLRKAAIFINKCEALVLVNGFDP